MGILRIFKFSIAEDPKFILVPVGSLEFYYLMPSVKEFIYENESRLVVL